MPETTEEEEVRPSAKREITATVVSVVVGLGLSIGANILISKASKKVHDQIAKPENETEE